MKINTGDTVKFRCGGRAIVFNKSEHRRSQEIEEQTGYKYTRFSLGFAGFAGSGHGYYKQNGYYGINEYEHSKHALDIVDVAPAEFDWDTVKRGMAFKDGLGTQLCFVGHHLHDEKLVICEHRYGYNNYIKDKLTRVPEKDLPL